jgi:hypothetical protein
MACPLFVPASPLTGFTDLYGGACAAEPGALIPVDVLRQCCNTGYARGSCQRAGRSEADAFRFLIKANRNGAVDVAWSSERNHHPVAVGTLAVDCKTGTTPRAPLESQARAYAVAYLLQNGGQIGN